MAVFEEDAEAVIQGIVSNLPLSFTREDLLREIHTFLDLSVKEIRLRGKVPLEVKAIDFPKYPNPPYWGENNEILHQADFQAAQRLYTDENLTMLNEPMQQLRKKAGKLGIDWNDAATVVRRVADKFGPDERAAAVKRGEFGQKIREELTRIRDDRRKFRSFEELASIYPTFEVVRMLKAKCFDQEDRDLLSQPNRWGAIVAYANGLLVNYFDKSLHTIRQDRKKFRAWKRLQKPKKL